MIFSEMTKVMAFLQKFGLNEVQADGGQFFAFCGPKKAKQIMEKMTAEDKEEMNRLGIRYLDDIGLYHT